MEAEYCEDIQKNGNYKEGLGEKVYTRLMVGYYKRVVPIKYNSRRYVWRQYNLTLRN